MLKIAPFIIFLFIICTPLTYAESSASVKVQNNINTSNSNNSNIESHTEITVETDGEVTRFSSDEPNQKIEVKSINGQSSIKVNGEEKTNTSNQEISNAPTPTILNEIEPTPTPVTSLKEILKERFDFIEKIFSFLDSLRK